VVGYQSAQVSYNVADDYTGTGFPQFLPAQSGYQTRARFWYQLYGEAGFT